MKRTNTFKLEEDIRRIATQAKNEKEKEIVKKFKNLTLILNRALQNIFALGAPTPSKEVSEIQFGVDAAQWNDLKKDDVFWREITLLLDLPSYTALDPQTERALFGLDQMNEVLGPVWIYDLDNTLHLSDFSRERELEAQRLARSQFSAYLRWYDSEASIHFLVIYGAYLSRLHPQQLVRIEETKRHKPARQPQQQQPPVRPPPIKGQRQGAPPQEQQSATTVLNIVKEQHFIVRSGLTLVTADMITTYSFSMLKETDEIKAPPFVIRVGQNERQVPMMRGLVTRVLKFVHRQDVYLVLSGPESGLLLQFDYVNPEKGITVIANFAFPAINDFDDINYFTSQSICRFATNMKSVENVNALLLLDLDRFVSMRNIKEGAGTRKLNELSKEQRKRYIRERALGPIYLDEEERAFLAFKRGVSVDQISPQLAFSDVSLKVEEKEYIQKATGYVGLEVTYEAEDLFVPLTMPLTPQFKFNQAPYRKNDLECLAAKVIQLPVESAFLAFNLGKHQNNPSLQNGLMRLSFFLIVLGRRYHDDSQPHTSLEFYIFRYQDIGANFKSVHTQKFDLSSDLVPLDTTNRVKEMNLIFNGTSQEVKKGDQIISHPASFFYLELMIEKKATQQYVMVSSEPMYYDFQFFSLPPITPLVIRDEALFTLIRQRGYKVYDDRHNYIPNVLPRYDAIFYRYNYETGKARVVFYRANRGDGAPGIAIMSLGGVKPGNIQSIVPLRNENNLCFITVKTENVPIPQLLKITLRHDFVLYDPQTINLSSAFEKALTLESSSSPPSIPFCTLCGELEPMYRDSESQHLYCDELCQYLFCRTNSL